MEELLYRKFHQYLINQIPDVYQNINSDIVLDQAKQVDEKMQTMFEDTANKLASEQPDTATYEQYSVNIIGINNMLENEFNNVLSEENSPGNFELVP